MSSGSGGGHEDKDEGPGKTALTFFRVFDLAFFAPGALLGLGALHVVAVMPGRIDVHDFKEPGPAVVVLLGIIGVLISFCIGAIVQTLARVCGIRNKGKKLAEWYFEVDKEAPAVYLRANAATRNDLVTYFWYLRSTFANLSLTVFALGLLYGLMAPHGEGKGELTALESFGIVVTGFIGALALAIGSGEMDIALKNLPEQKKLPEQSPPAQNPPEEE